MTYTNVNRTQIHTEVETIQVFTAWLLNTSRHKTAVIIEPVMCENNGFYDLLELPNRLSNPFGHPLQVCAQATFANFRVRLPWGQFNKETTSVVFYNCRVCM